MDIQKMLKDAEALQKSLMEAESELEKIEVKGVAGGGLVEVLMNAKSDFKNIKLKKEAVNPNDIETLEDLIVSAFRDAVNKAEVLSRDKLAKITGNKNLPPIF